MASILSSLRPVNQRVRPFLDESLGFQRPTFRCPTARERRPGFAFRLFGPLGSCLSESRLIIVRPIPTNIGRTSGVSLKRRPREELRREPQTVRRRPRSSKDDQNSKAAKPRTSPRWLEEGNQGISGAQFRPALVRQTPNTTQKEARQRGISWRDGRGRLRTPGGARVEPVDAAFSQGGLTYALLVRSPRTGGFLPTAIAVASILLSPQRATATPISWEYELLVHGSAVSDGSLVTVPDNTPLTIDVSIDPSSPACSDSYSAVYLLSGSADFLGFQYSVGGGLEINAGVGGPCFGGPSTGIAFGGVRVFVGDGGVADGPNATQIEWGPAPFGNLFLDIPPSDLLGSAYPAGLPPLLAQCCGNSALPLPLANLRRHNYLSKPKTSVPFRAEHRRCSVSD